MVRPSHGPLPPNHHNGPFRRGSVRPTLRAREAGFVHSPKERGGATMDSDSAGELNDDALSAEIELLGQLMLAASSVTRHLTQAEVDQVLEVETAPQPVTTEPSG